MLSLSLSPHPAFALEEANSPVVNDPREMPTYQETDLWPMVKDDLRPVKSHASELGQVFTLTECGNDLSSS